MLKRIGILLLYCLPALVAVGFSLWASYDRALGVAEKLEDLLESVDSDDDLVAALKDFAQGDDGNKIAQALLDYLAVHREVEEHAGPAGAALTPGAADQADAEDERHLRHFLGDLVLKKEDKSVRASVEKIWWRQAVIVITMTLLPFLLLGSALAFDRRGEKGPNGKTGLSISDKWKLARERWALKLLFSGVIMAGWTYVVNPIGRGATLVYTFAQTSNLLSTSSLPLAFDSQNLISPTACGFLGWYLHMLGYFFKKLYQHDTASSRVYGLLFRKLLFVYGISLMIAVVPSDSAKIVAFLIGFFPLSALKTVQELAAKSAQKNKEQQEATLMDLPCISRWQALRLEEEGIEDIPALASTEPWRLRARLPIKPEVVDLWIDAARLISIVGIERYKKLETVCQTATHFEIRSGDADFRQQIYEEYQIGNPDEIVSLLRATFSPISQEATQPG